MPYVDHFRNQIYFYAFYITPFLTSFIYRVFVTKRSDITIKLATVEYSCVTLIVATKYLTGFNLYFEYTSYMQPNFDVGYIMN